MPERAGRIGVRRSYLGSIGLDNLPCLVREDDFLPSIWIVPFHLRNAKLLSILPIKARQQASANCHKSFPHLTCLLGNSYTSSPSGKVV